MIDRIRRVLSRTTKPIWMLAISKALSYVAIFVPCYYMCDVLVDNDVLQLVLTGLLTEGIHRLTAASGYMEATLDAENKVQLDPSKGKYAVIYYNEIPVSGVKLSDGAAEVSSNADPAL